MKKNLTILSAILITLFSLTAKAQDDADKPRPKSYMAFLGGLSTPSGDFKQTNYSNNSSGFAKTGATFALDAGIYVYKNLAIGLTFSFQDQGELSANDAQIIANGYNASAVKDITTVTAVNRYHSLNLMMGPQYSFLYKKFTLDLRASAGFIKSTSTPLIVVIFDNSNNSAGTLYQLNSTALAFGYSGSAGLHYSLGDGWDVILKANYVDCSGIKIENSGNPGTVGRIQTNLPITEFQTTIGMAIKF
jgi:hypothetical protein